MINIQPIEDICKFVVHNHGSNIAIGIEGKRCKEVYNTFWNWGATQGECMEVSNHFVWFWTQPKRFINTLRQIIYNRLALQGGEKGKKGGFKEEAKVIVAKILLSIKEEKFVPASE